MALSILESIRRLIRQDTVRIGGPVGNLYGAVTSDLNLLQGLPVQSWLVLEATGSEMPDVERFYQLYGIFGGRMQLLVAQDGSVTVPSPQAGRLQLIRATATIAQRSTFTLRVAVTQPGGACAVYVNGTLARRGEGVTLIPITLDSGTHDITIISNATTATVTAPTGLELSGESDIPGRPTWVRVTTDYLDTSVGTAQNTLTWLADAKVGGYYVLRRQRVSLRSTAEGASASDSSVLSFGETGADGSYPVILQGLHATQLTVGSELLAEFESLGVITQVLPENGGNTSVRLRALPGQAQPTSNVIGSLAYLGTFSPITQVARTTNASTLVYVDSAVTFGQAYEYALVAYGLINPAMRSQRSEVIYVVAGDVQPPGSITFLSGYPEVTRGVLTARFTTPVDADYQGVRVYFHQRIQNEIALDQFADYTVTSVAGRVISINDPELAVNALVGYKVRWNNGVPYDVVSNTAGTITVSADLLPPPSNGVSLTIYRNVQIKTDYGNPNTSDELSFTVSELGRYVFCTFDRARNEQLDFEAAYYDVTSLGGGTGVEPIVAFRQLVSGEQSYFASPFNNPFNYAIVEVWAANSGASEATKFDGVELWYRRKGDDSDRLLSPVPSQARAFPWVVSGSAQGILDQPNFGTVAPYPPAVSGGVLSRYVSLARSEADNWIRVWAENSDGLSTDIMTFVVDYDTTPEITSLETTIDNDADTASFTAIIDDDTQGLRWYVDPASAGEPTETVPAHLGSVTLKRFIPTPVIALPLGSVKKLCVTPYASWTTINATVTGVAGRVLTCSGSVFPTASPGLVRYQVTYPGSKTYLVESNTANSLTVSSGFVAPLPINGTQLSISYAAAPSGPMIERTLVRTPRSFVAFENKNSNGERDVNFVTAVFTQIPAPAVVSGQTGTGTLTEGSGGFVLTDTAKAWSTDQFTSVGPTQWYFLRITGSAGTTLVRRIISNTAMALRLEGGLPSTSLSEFASARPYQIIDGAVIVRNRLSESDSLSASGFLPTTGRETYKRSATFYLDYFATKNGCGPENVRSILVDPDTDASITGLTLSYDATTRRLTAQVTGIDDDCKYWELYLRRGDWPTTGATPTVDGPVDSRFLRYTSSSVDSSALIYTQTVEPGNVWRAIAIPYNSFNQAGTRKSASITTDGAGGTPSALLTLDWIPQAGLSTGIATVTAQSGASGAGFTITASDNAVPGTTYTNNTGVLNTAITGGQFLGTSTITGMPFVVSAVETTNRRTWTVTVTSGARTPITIERSFYAVVGGTPPGGNPSVTVPATAITVNSLGTCTIDGCASGDYRPLLLQVQFTTANANVALHQVAIDIDVGNTGFVPSTWGVTPTNALQSFIHGFQCYVYNIGGAPTTIQFRVRVIRIDDNSTVSTATTEVFATNLFRCDAGYEGGVSI